MLETRLWFAVTHAKYIYMYKVHDVYTNISKGKISTYFKNNLLYKNTSLKEIEQDTKK